MAEIIHLEEAKRALGRDYFKRDLFGVTVTPDEVMLAATNIYQSELGFWFEDEAWDDPMAIGE